MAAAVVAAAVTQASRRERQRAQGHPNGCGASELSAGSGAGPGQALGSRGVFRRRSLTSTSAAATASSSLPLPPRPSTGPARSTPGNASGGVAESSPSGTALSSAYVRFPFPLHCPKCRRSQREGLKPKWGGEDFTPYHLEFKIGYKAAETTHNIHNVFGLGTANENVQCSGGSRSFAKERRALKMWSIVAGHWKLTTTN
ncbi:uncharacterized protein LOC103792470 [Callithrix jacchus]